MPTVLELRERRATLVNEAREIDRRVTAEKREYSAEERQNFDRIMSEVDSLKETIDKQEGDEAFARRRAALATLETEMRTSQGRAAPAAGVSPAAAAAVLEQRDKQARKFEKRKAEFGETIARRSTPEYRAAFSAWLKGGDKRLSAEHRAVLERGEGRALQADADVVGGYLIPPIQFVQTLIRFVSDLVFVRKLATVVPVTNAQSLGVPSLDSDPSDADWTSEVATGNEDSTMAFGRRDFSPHPLAKRIKISNKLLRLAPNVEQLVNERLAYKFAVTEEKSFLQGNGSQQPLGVFTATPLGIDTSRDVNTGNTTTAVTADGLMEAKYALKYQYQVSPSTAWGFHRTTVKMIRKLKDANGQYLWAPGLTGGAPDTILDKPYFMSEYVPNTYTTGQYVGILGDWKFYWIADSLNWAIQRLDELYAETNQTGFIARRELDGMPVLAQAFVRVTLS